MAISYLVSENVGVFPSAGRVVIPTGKFTSEHNFINIVKSTTDEVNRSSDDGRVYDDGYIISKTTSGGITTLKLVIHGYIFDIDDSLSTNIWYGILVRDTDEKLVAWDAVGNDLDTKLNDVQTFKGLVKIISPTNPTDGDIISGYTRYYLHITDGTGTLLSKAYHKLSSASVEYDSGVSVKSELSSLSDGKQDKLTVGSSAGLTLDESNNLQMDRTLYNYITDIDNSTVGSYSKPIVWSAGKPIILDTGNIGAAWAKPTESAKYYVRTDAIMVNGQWQAGNSIYAGTTEPDNNIGNDGDVWIRYSN